MSTSNRNPYERRDQSQRSFADTGEERATNMQAPTPLGLYDVARQRLEMADEVDHVGLTLGDLEAVIKAKVYRARRDGDDAAYMRTRDEVAAARRTAWDEGHAAGVIDGQRELRTRISFEFTEDVNDLRDRLSEFFNRLDPAEAWKSTTKVDAADLLCEARDMFAKLIDAHHAGFPEHDQASSELPF